MKENNSPAYLNYKIPPEWHQHAATQMHWPHNGTTWPGNRLQKVEKVYLDIIEVLHRYEPIHLFVNNKVVKEQVRELFKRRDIKLQQITFHQQPTNDVWARDCGPVFIQRQKNGSDEFAITDWEYNAWGGKYPPYNTDNSLPAYVAYQFGIKTFNPGMVLEGGSIETNGDGVLITTESVLLHKNRNPNFTKAEIEQRLMDYLGIEKIIWLKEGLAGDDTDGHIDAIARFLNRDTILMIQCANPADVNYATLQQNLKIVQHKFDQYGNAFTIETLPMPKAKIEGTTVDGSKYVPASYANFYVANGVVLVPLYHDPHDEEALALFRKFFPDRDIYGIFCEDLVWGQGSIHCITQQWYGLNLSYSGDENQ